MQYQDCRQTRVIKGIKSQIILLKKKSAHFKRNTKLSTITVMSCGISGRLTLKVASAADFPGPTRLHLEPKAERELA